MSGSIKLWGTKRVESMDIALVIWGTRLMKRPRPARCTIIMRPGPGVRAARPPDPTALRYWCATCVLDRPYAVLCSIRAVSPGYRAPKVWVNNMRSAPAASIADLASIIASIVPSTTTEGRD